MPSPPIPLLDEDDLADVSLEDESPTAVCDQDPSNAYGGGPVSQIACYDGLELGFRALRTRVASVERLYLHRRSCAGLRCTPAELDTVEVIGWLGGAQYTVVITVDPSMTTVPLDGAAAPWPAASSSVPPPVARPAIEGAPRAVRQRVPYPHCGQEPPSDSGQSDERKFEINRCFFDGVLDARPVEMVLITDVPRAPVVLRFDGRGFVTRYMPHGSPRAWYRDQGPVILGSSVYFGLSHDAEGVRIDG